MKIANREIGGNNPPYIVAEISGNHCGILDNAKRLIKAAKRAGADAVKTQCYDADALTLPMNKPDFIAQNGLWKGRQLYELYQKAQTPYSWQRDLYKVARDEGIPIFSSVFDYRGVDLLEALDCPAYKIASFEIVDLPLIAYAAKTGKPLIISTGLANDTEILEANNAAGTSAAFLHCTSEYPASIESANLGYIHRLEVLLKFSHPIGISDHTQGHLVPVAATAMGATIIEKHLKLLTPVDDRESEDESFSLFPEDFTAMAKAVRSIHMGMQEIQTDKSGRQFRRSIYAIKDIAEGEQYTTQNIRSIRPAYGLPPKMLPLLLGKKAKRSWRKGEPLS